MYQHFDALGFDAEEPFGFDHLKPLVHHRGTVDRDLGAHLPVGVFQGARRSDAGQLFDRRRAEGTSRRGEEDFVDGIAVFAHQALENRAVFAVHGQNRRAVFHRELRNEFARHNERFLVGQRDGFASFDGRHRGAESGETHHGRHHHVHFGQSGDVADGFRARPHLNGEVGQRLAHRFIARLVGDDHRFGAKFARLRNEQFGVVPRREGIGLVFAGVFAHHVEGLRADRAGRTE